MSMENLIKLPVLPKESSNLLAFFITCVRAYNSYILPLFVKNHLLLACRGMSIVFKFKARFFLSVDLREFVSRSRVMGGGGGGGNEKNK